MRATLAPWQSPTWSRAAQAQVYDAKWTAMHERVLNPDPVEALCEVYCKAKEATG